MMQASILKEAKEQVAILPPEKVLRQMQNKVGAETGEYLRSTQIYSQ